MNEAKDLTSNEEATAPELEAVAIPSITFESLTFSDGTTIQLEPSDIVVFVGPNNAGKSKALRELQEYIGSPTKQAVITAATLRVAGTADDLLSFLEKRARKSWREGQLHYTGLG